ncbi:hypothetical protein [Mammaliicoccus sciuri]|uniref:hypothetical protein n=1 Tax=Mammaliicoccus sciuri TaxID=1296 RepID=UPI001FB2C2A3|nr:hypothetical protein [Mammaliicoccus sciuri]MCJ0909774.1 hypothetical protein [Mammaliicoccus sciuri]MCJ0922232.1 hypothetical protein [Mammaliicoccus sciuri]MCJ0925284.1 hypothetical protein [Mammaliicoccus sciuri]MCJ1761613.1 hypothetical protein [Mammaliicoccus sciuri]MEB6118858.1 hypothetical protein [Mammaliicoccus sciuri]
MKDGGRMQKRLLDNQRLIRGASLFLIFVIGALLYSFMPLPKMLIFMVPLFILLVLFCDWLRGVEEAKNIKRFMTYRVIVLLIGVVLLVQYFLSMYREDVKYLYLFAWLIISFIADIIENKYFIKKELSN